MDIMVGVLVKPDAHQKLRILSSDAQYDLACACSGEKDQHRKRGADGRWIYPVTLANGGKSILFKTLISNVCNNDCTYCPLRDEQDIRRCSLSPRETAEVFLDYYNRREVFGLFLSSGVCGSPDASMQRLIDTAELLRKKHDFRGYVHLKVIPGASDAAVEKALSVANAVSVNIETPGEKPLAKLSKKKNFIRDIVEPMKLISRLTSAGSKYHRVKQTTQFVVGAAEETDGQIVKYMAALYDRLKMNRIYFSAYQKQQGDDSVESSFFSNEQSSMQSKTTGFVREHRLYQVDFLLRKYGFKGSDITFGLDGNLSLDVDPKQTWALKHPAAFPVNPNYASPSQLLKVPGIGPITVRKILQRRKQGRLTSLHDIARYSATLGKAEKYLVF
jgi:predicted DNA-binding helix-hairpin-helix protein